MVQMDPTSVVARTEHLVLWSRLGRRFRVAELERLLWRDRELFEYRAHILPTADLPMHRISMRRYPQSDLTRHAYVRAWLRANDTFVRYVLGEFGAGVRCAPGTSRIVPWRGGRRAAGTTRARTCRCCSTSSGPRAA